MSKLWLLLFASVILSSFVFSAEFSYVMRPQSHAGSGMYNASDAYLDGGGFAWDNATDYQPIRYYDFGFQLPSSAEVTRIEAVADAFDDGGEINLLGYVLHCNYNKHSTQGTNNTPLTETTLYFKNWFVLPSFDVTGNCTFEDVNNEYFGVNMSGLSWPLGSKTYLDWIRLNVTYKSDCGFNPTNVEWRVNDLQRCENATFNFIGDGYINITDTGQLTLRNVTLNFKIGTPKKTIINNGTFIVKDSNFKSSDTTKYFFRNYGILNITDSKIQEVGAFPSFGLELIQGGKADIRNTSFNESFYSIWGNTGDDNYFENIRSSDSTGFFISGANSQNNTFVDINCYDMTYCFNIGSHNTSIDTVNSTSNTYGIWIGAVDDTYINDFNSYGDSYGLNTKGHSTNVLMENSYIFDSKTYGVFVAGNPYFDVENATISCSDGCEDLLIKNTYFDNNYFDVNVDCNGNLTCLNCYDVRNVTTDTSCFGNECEYYHKWYTLWQTFDQGLGRMNVTMHFKNASEHEFLTLDTNMPNGKLNWNYTEYRQYNGVQTNFSPARIVYNGTSNQADFGYPKNFWWDNETTGVNQGNTTFIRVISKCGNPFGDWIVYNDQGCYNHQFTLAGNLTILNESDLVLDQIDLNMSIHNGTNRGQLKALYTNIIADGDGSIQGFNGNFIFDNVYIEGTEFNVTNLGFDDECLINNSLIANRTRFVVTVKNVSGCVFDNTTFVQLRDTLFDAFRGLSSNNITIINSRVLGNCISFFRSNNTLINNSYVNCSFGLGTTKTMSIGDTLSRNNVFDNIIFDGAGVSTNRLYNSYLNLNGFFGPTGILELKRVGISKNVNITGESPRILYQSGTINLTLIDTNLINGRVDATLGNSHILGDNFYIYNASDPALRIRNVNTTYKNINVISTQDRCIVRDGTPAPPQFTGGEGWVIDSFLNCTGAIVGHDGVSNFGVDTILLNVTFADTSNKTYNSQGCPVLPFFNYPCFLKYNYYVKVNVTYNTSWLPCDGCDIDIYNSSNVYLGTESTDATGFTQKFNLTINATNGTMWIYPNPYTFKTKKDGYENITIINITNNDLNILMHLLLEELEPAEINTAILSHPLLVKKQEEDLILLLTKWLMMGMA